MKAKSTTSARQRVKRSQLQQFFADIGSRMELSQTNSVGSSRPLVARSELSHFFISINRRVELAEAQQRRRDKRHATAFNVFNLIEPDENKLSDILADLLDPEGEHGQGDLFLRLLFKQLGLGSSANLTKKATVHREASTHGIMKYRRRMDVFVDAGALLAIENKVDAVDQQDQVKHYLEHLQYCSRGNRKKSVLDLPALCPGNKGRPQSPLTLHRSMKPRRATNCTAGATKTISANG